MPDRTNYSETETQRETIGIHFEAFAAGRALVPIPTKNPMVGPTLEVVTYTDSGIHLILTDPYGAVVWDRLLEGADLMQEPQHGIGRANEEAGRAAGREP